MCHRSGGRRPLQPAGALFVRCSGDRPFRVRTGGTISSASRTGGSSAPPAPVTPAACFVTRPVGFEPATFRSGGLQPYSRDPRQSLVFTGDS
jgi:hypothetical protein